MKTEQVNQDERSAMDVARRMRIQRMEVLQAEAVGPAFRSVRLDVANLARGAHYSPIEVRRQLIGSQFMAANDIHDFGAKVTNQDIMRLAHHMAVTAVGVSPQAAQAAALDMADHGILSANIALAVDAALDAHRAHGHGRTLRIEERPQVH